MTRQPSVITNFGRNVRFRPRHLYPKLATFRSLCRRVDPDGVFRNTFVERALGFDARPAAATGDAGQ
jgi:hypothetical protein